MNFWCLFLLLITISANEIDFDLNNEHVHLGQSPQSDGNDQKTKEEKLDFAKPLYIINDEKQKLKNGYKIPFDVQMNQELKVKGALKLSDAQNLGMEEYVKATQEKDGIKISIDVKLDIPEENIKDKGQLIFLLEFTPEKKDDDTIRTVLILFLQDKPPEKPEKIIFEKPAYKINTFTEYIGLIGEFVAKLDKNDGKSVIKYNLETDKEPLKNSLKLEEQSGVLQITKSLTPGTYDFKISAKIDSGISSEADVSLVISHIIVCDSKTPKFQHSQFVKHIAEDTTGEIFPAATPTASCVYKIAYQEPKGDYFQLDENTGALKMAKGIKRDDELFKNTYHPKFIIKLEVNCDSAAANNEPQDDQRLSAGYFNIPYNPTQMFLIVVIDKAENKPIFNTEKIFVGYPKKYDIITQYGPPRVTSIAPFVNDRATSSMKYSIIEENSPFSIDPNTGNIYPLSYYNKDEDYSFTVQARDVIDIKDGKVIPKPGKLVVSVKPLTISQIVEIYFIGEALEKIDELLQEYNKNLDIEIKSLVQSVVPVTAEQRQSNKALDDKKQIHLLRALCYALDKNKNEHAVVKGEIIVDKLKSSSSVFSIQVLENKRTPDSKGRNGSNSFIVTTSIFSVILALGVIVTVFYLVYMRRRNMPVIIMRRNTNTRSSVTALEDDMEGPSQTRWIGPREDAYSRFEHMNTVAFPNPTFERTQRVSYSDTTGGGEVILMQNSASINSNVFPTSSSVSSFKPSSANENFSSNNINENVYRDVEFPSTGIASSTSISNNNAPVIDVTSLPAVSEQQWRRRTNTDDKDA